MNNRILFFTIFLTLVVSLQAQNRLDFDKLSIEDGFTSSKANAIIQDRKGFIWIGTWNGLNRYDGYHCEAFRPRYHDSTSISNREVVELLEDNMGNIWIGTSSGLNCLNPTTGQIKQFHFENRIIALHEDRENMLWIGTWNGGLYRLNPETGQTDHFLSNENISDILEDSRKNLWIATYYGLINFDRKTAGYVRYLPNGSNPDHSISHSVVTQIVEAADGTLWLGTWGGGLNKVLVHPDKDRIRFIHYWSQNRPGALSSNVVYKLYSDPFGNLWVGTWNNGLNRLTSDQQTLPPDLACFQVYQNDLSDPYSLSGNNISALCVDRSGILWIGSSKINRTNILKTGISRYKTNQLINGQSVDNNVRSLAIQKDNLWVGTSHRLLLYRQSNQQYEPVKTIEQISYDQDPYRYYSNSILAIGSNNDGLWVGTEDAGLIFFKGESALEDVHPRFTWFNRGSQPSLPGNKVGNLCCSQKYPGTVWIGTMQNGFARLNYQQGQADVTQFGIGKSEKYCSDNNIRAVLEDRNGLVWIGTQNGLNVFDPETATFKHFFFSLTDTQSINDNVINCLLEDQSGNLWIGTNAGLNRKMERPGQNGKPEIYFKAYPQINNLNGEIILNILEDPGSRHLWLVLYRGLAEFDTGNETIENEYFIKEFQNIRIERGSALRSPNGDLFFGGANGFISFNPDSLFKHSPVPQVCLTDLLISNESIENLSKTKPQYRLSSSIAYCQQVKLSYKDRILTFVFSAMDFKNPQKNNYSYFLEGYDHEWNQVGARNTATYTSIPPGKYTFKVKASNSDGIWSDETRLIRLTITPPWWKTYWAYILYFLLILGLLYFFKEYSIIQVREKGRLLIERMQKEEAQKLDEMKSRFFTDITHEFRTPLTLILGPANELIEEKNQQPHIIKQAEIINRNAQKLLRLVNQLMEFRKVEKGKIEFLPQTINLTALFNETYESFKSMAHTKNIDFKLLLQSTDLIATVDVEKMEKVVYNLVSNAFKYSEDGGQITLRAGIGQQGNDRILTFEVEDTGIGISEENRKKVFERFFQAHQKRTQSTGGIGLYLTKAFVDQHRGSIEVDSEPGKGSCFKVSIPAGQETRLTEIFPATDQAGIDKSDFLPGESEAEQSPGGIVTQHRKLPLVLIAEDDHDLNHFIADGLQPAYHVLTTSNGKEAFEQARKHNPDLIVSDIMMPEMDGFELCEQLRKDLATSHIPLVFLTAKTMHEDEVKGLRTGAVDYICKPFSMVSLKLKIQNILDHQRLIQEKIRTKQLLEPESIELSSLDETFLKQAVDTVNRFLDDPEFDVEQFSYEMGISSNQAYRKIKALTGQTAKEFIRNQRLKTAASLLLQKRRSISEIIYMVGFSSPSYFTRCFKEYYGCTPKEYIERSKD